jgi:Galactose-3-O-sulfotransferase
MHNVESEWPNSRRPGEPRRCIIFLHVPKTAGWTLRGALHYKYPSEILFLDEASDPCGGIEGVPLEERRRARVATGHVFYGVQEHIPQPAEFITVLRDPIARVVSMYNHVRRRQKHRLHDEVAGSGMGLEEFARSCADAGIDNQQTRLISGRARGEVVSRDSGKGGTWVAPRLERTDLERAKRNLDNFLLVGLTERFDETFILLRRALGWRLPMYMTRNVGRAANGSAPERPSELAVELIRKRNALDLELYEHATRLFEDAVARQPPSFQREVAAFRMLNRIPNALGPRIPARLRHPLRAVLPR